MTRHRIPILALLLVLAAHGGVGAAVLNSDTDYSGSGNWVGTAGPDTMTNNNGVTINGSILAEDGNDQVIMETGPDKVAGVINGGAGIDEIIYGGGTWTQGHASVVNFEDFSINATADLTLNGAWDLGNVTAQVSGGSLTINNSLKAGGLTIGSGSATINGSTVISGAVSNQATLDVVSGGALNAGSLDNSGTTSIAGAAVITDAVNNSGGLDVTGSLIAGSLVNSGNLGVTGSLTTGSLVNSGGLGVGGSLSADSLVNSSNLGVGGSLNVGSLVNSGGLGVGGSLTADSLINSGALGVGGSLIAGSLINSGNLAVGGSLIAGSLVNSGNLGLGGSLIVDSLVNSGELGLGGTLIAGSLVNSGNLGLGGSLIADSLVNSGSLPVGGTLIAGSLDNSGFLPVGGTLIAGSLDNSGTLDVGGSLSAGSLTNSGDLTVTTGGWLEAGSLINSGALVVDGRLSAGSLGNSGALDINGSLSAGSLTNAGDLTVAAGGSLKAVSLFNSGYALISGIATIDGDTDNTGSLMVDGSFASASLANSGFIGGSGTIHADLINTGVLSPGNSIGTLTIASSVVFEAGSTLVSELDCTCLCDLLDVSGGVTINGGTVYTAIPRGLYVNGHAWEVISASQGVSGLFDSIDNQTKSAVLGLGQANSGEALSLVITRKSYGAFASGGAADTGRGLDGLVPLAQGDMESLLVAMDFDLEADRIAKVVNALNPEMYTAYSAASLNAGRLFDRAMGMRLEQWGQRRAYSLKGSHAASGLVQLAAAEAALPADAASQAPRGWGVWGRALGLRADQKEAGGYLGRGQTTGGVAIGADYEINDWLVLGLAAGATRTNTSWSGGNDEGDTDAMHTGLYAQAGLHGFFTRATASYARLASNASRPVHFENFGANAKADFDAKLFAAGLSLGYQARLGAWLLEPVAGLDYQMLKEEGFSERDADFLGLDIAGRDTESNLFKLGMSATRLIRAGNWEVLPRLGLSWQHQLGDERPSLEAAFTGYGSVPFNVSGAGFPNDLAIAEAGLSATMRPGLDFFADYSFAFADDYQVQTLSVGLRISL